MTFRAWFKTAKNPTCRNPSESTREAPNSLLSHSPSHSEPFWAWIPKICVPIKTYCTHWPFAELWRCHELVDACGACGVTASIQPIGVTASIQSLQAQVSSAEVSKGGKQGGQEKGIFCRNRRKWLEMARTHRQKAIQGLLSRFRRSPGGRIFDRFEPGSLSTFFQKSDRQ